MTTKQRVYVLVFAGVMLLACVGVFAYIIVVSVKSTIAQVKAPPPQEDRKLVVTAEDLQRFGAGVIVAEHETFSSTKSIDGTRMVEYEYTFPATEGKSRIYIQSTAQIFAQSLSTMQMFKMQQLALKGGLAVAGETTQEPAPALVNVGDGRFAMRLKSKKTGEPVGNVFMIRQGRAMLTVIVVGLTFDDAETVEKLIGPALAEQKRRFVKG
ncbi:MAG TPA: hypothetical protein VHW00_03700 [Thermoanaerobaculia bacterium]|nr:hypothetical protein [Thermoanaerobaculia bacterium]